MGRLKKRKPIGFLRNDTLLFGLAVAAVWLVLMSFHGLLPNMAETLPAKFSELGAIQCGEHSLGALAHAHCYLVGGDYGALLTLGLPYVVGGALAMKVLHVSVTIALFLVSSAIMLIALLGAYRLIREMKVSRYIALAGAALYFVMPLTRSMHQFDGTYWGFLLLPAALYAIWYILQKLPKATWRGWLAAVAAWTFVSGFMLFMDGYSFFMYVIASVIFLFFWSWGQWRRLYVWLAGGIFLLANGVAYKAYHHLIPSSGTWSDSIDLFRAMGVDVITLIRPAADLWWVKALGIHIKGAPLWGDGSNSAFNYIGIFVLGLFLYGVYVSRKHLSRLGAALLVLGAVAFMFSLGPSLKINSAKPANALSIVSHASYLMPSTDAVVTLPTQPVYKIVPGLKSMRAIYRWHIVTVIVLITFATVAIQSLLDRKRLKLGYVLLGLMILEMLPSPLQNFSSHIKTNNQLLALNKDVVDPLSTYIRPDERILYYPNAVGNNDYLANYITPLLGARAYNVGGDKAQSAAYPYMPASVKTLLSTDDSVSTLPMSGARMNEVLGSGLVDAIVVPTFDLRWNSYSWPPTTPDARQRAEEVIAYVRKEPNLLIQKSSNFYIVSLKTARL